MPNGCGALNQRNDLQIAPNARCTKRQGLFGCGTGTWTSREWETPNLLRSRGSCRFFRRPLKEPV
jgi:hypothetical protein